MVPPKAAVAQNSAPPRDGGQIDECPVATPGLIERLDVCRGSARDLAIGMNDVLSAYTDGAKARWLKGAVESSQVVFQPWTMEILFTLAVMRETRFTEMQRLLGMSSRTLSDKLQTLRAEGLVDREVFDEQPVRIEYRLTKEGRAVAALATPLFAQLNLRRARA